MNAIDIRDIARNAFRTRSIPEDGTVITDATYAWHRNDTEAIAAPLVVDGATDGDVISVTGWDGNAIEVTLPAYVFVEGITWCDTPRLTFTPWWSFYYRHARVISTDEFLSEGWEKGRAGKER